MSAKTSATRRRAFFAALAETGNQTVAAERARVSRSWVSLHRAKDPAFRADMEAAIASARERLRAAADDPMPTGWGSIAGEELVMRGSNGRCTQIARARLKQWTPRIEARFLAALEASCNVKAACAAVGLSPASAYNRRRSSPRFDQRWAVSLDIGYDRIEAALVGNAARSFGEIDIEPEMEMPPVTVGEALQLLRLHQAQARGVGRFPGKWRRPRTLAEVTPGILAKLERIECLRQRRAAGIDEARDRRVIAEGERVVAAMARGKPGRQSR